MIVKLLIAYLVLMNLVAFLSMGRDKRKAVSHRPRTPERRLLAYALLGGSAGSLLGMSVYRHKTKHLKFTLGIPVILILQAGIGAAVIILF